MRTRTDIRTWARSALLALFVMTGGACLHAQDAVFSEPASAALSLNPAMAGVLHDVDAQLVHRTRRIPIGTPYRTVYAGVDGCLHRGKEQGAVEAGRLAGGIHFRSDNSQALRSTEFAAVLAYHVPLTQNSSLGAGLSLGLLQTVQGDVDGQWGSQYNGLRYDANLPSYETLDATRHTGVDMGGGMLYALRWNEGREERQSHFIVGLSAAHLSRPQLFGNGPQDRIPVRWSLFATSRILLAGAMNWISPEAYVFKQGPRQLLIAGGSFGHVFGSPVSFQNAAVQVEVELGAAYRSDDAILAKLRVGWSAFSVTMVYDIPSGGPDHSNSATEIALGYALNKVRK